MIDANLKRKLNYFTKILSLKIWNNYKTFPDLSYRNNKLFRKHIFLILTYLKLKLVLEKTY